MSVFPQNINFAISRTKEVKEAIAARRGRAHSVMILDTAISILKIQYVSSLAAKAWPDAPEEFPQFLEENIIQDIVASLMASLAYGIIGPSTLDHKDRPDVQRDLETLSNDIHALVKAMHIH